ncbi:MAG: gamma-glutamyl-gamma-aminobutyrate hydrolase family protein [Candidatus Sumerlaeia bacterium]
MKTRPLIGIECSSIRGETMQAPRAVLNVLFTQAIETAGGVPLIIPPRLTAASLDALLDAMDGLLLSGGPDLPPQMYGQSSHPLTRPLQDTRAVNAVHLVKGAIGRGLPVLGVCFGCQALNVALGGTLVQDIHTTPHPARVKHKYHFCPDFTEHSVSIAAGSRLESIMGGTHMIVNSCHHQAVARPGEGLRVVAQAPDGIIEAVEGPADRGFVLGVQWHPEYLTDRSEHLALFRALVETAGTRALAIP